MRTILLTMLTLLSAVIATAQEQTENPYAVFGNDTATLTAEPDDAESHGLAVPVVVADGTPAIAIFDFKHRRAVLLNADGDVLASDTIQDGQRGIWLNVDPKAGDYPHVTPYGYCVGNPVKLIDPDGRDTEVVQTGEKTYKVVGGFANEDRNIYLVNADGIRTGEVLGVSISSYSFLNEDNNPVIGAVIDLSDMSGKAFWDDFVANTPNIIKYMRTAGAGKHYDFKRRGTSTGDPNYNSTLYHTRGLYVNVGDNDYITSARDIGNMAAGYIAARNGLSWDEARLGFDAYESYERRKLTTESAVTQKAERFGYDTGIKEGKNTMGKLYHGYKQSLKARKGLLF